MSKNEIPLSELLEDLERENELIQYRIVVNSRSGNLVGYIKANNTLTTEIKQAHIFEVSRSMSQVQRNTEVKKTIMRCHRQLQEELIMNSKNTIRNLPFRSITIKASYI